MATLRILFVILLFASAAACGGDPPVLEVGPVGFPAEDVRGLSGDQLRTLARLTAVGLAVSENAVLPLGESFLERRREEALVQRLREHLALERAGIGEDVLRARYAADPEWELEVSHLVVLSERWRNEAHRTAARARAEEARERLLAGEDFGRVAADVSEEPGAAEREGRLQPGREGTWVREFWEAASALDPGEFSEVTETEYGFHVIFLEDRRQVPFAEARDRVEAEMAQVVDQRAAWDAWVEERTGGVEGESERRRILVETARERGLQVPEAEEARITREWERIVGSWIAVLGLEPGMSVTPIRERALTGLTRSGVEYTTLREQVNLHGPALDDAYPVRFPDRPEDG
ncbi:MAG: peptidylprolyl isomerase [Gemmatimonadota bacterium]